MLPDTSYDLPFRGLPPELRSQIYTHLLVSPDPFILTESPASTPSTYLDPSGAQPVHLSSHTPSPYLSLLLLYPTETPTIHTLFLTLNTFRLSTTCASAHHFLSSLPARTRLLLRHISIASKALYYYDTANRSFRTLFNYLAQEMALQSVEVCTYEGQNGVIDAVFREAARGVFEGLVGQMRVRYEIAPAYGLEGGENVLAGRVVWDEWEEGFVGRYAGAEGETKARKVGFREGRRGDGGDGGRDGGVVGEVLSTPMLSPYWTRFFKNDQARSELAKESRALYPFQLFAEHSTEFGDRDAVLVLKEMDRRVLQDRIGAAEGSARMVYDQSEGQSVTASAVLSRVNRAQRILMALDARREVVARIKADMWVDACAAGVRV
ncbi:Tuberous sclerosis 1 [Sphaceloma murrayae]|uniref:Tuberous sclerosis 1 n=1 Tax=Sphaceloma murrayae TaxID=2082308 RepID=A0A2K1QUZ3_9PEZI|nr:Tuberous sclerosis 1 [Sphaceloma murrayae]